MQKTASLGSKRPFALTSVNDRIADKAASAWRPLCNSLVSQALCDIHVEM